MTIMDSDSIIIGFSTNSNRNSLIAWAIRLVERTPYSHVYLKFYSASIDRWLVYHASHTNIHFNNLETFHQQNKVIEEYEIEAGLDARRSAMQECVDRVGWPYGMWQLFGMGVVRLINAWFDIQISNPFSDGKRTQVCSELAGHVLYKLGAPVELNKLEYEGPRYINQVVRGMVDSGSARRIF